jgi:S-disulfanyl-L-cysteine oxidoreductase SoxD
MRSPELRVWGLAAMVALTACTSTPSNQPVSGPAAHRPGLGKPVTEAQLAAWNIDIRTPDGLGLPPGSGSIAKGKAVYEGQCLVCHGPEAKGGPMFGTMVGGIGSFTTNTRVLTPGSMYPYAGVLFDYVRRAMPLTAPQSMSNEDVYAVSGYLLHLNGLLPADAVVDARVLRELRMPNRDGFIVDDRPDTKAIRCMSNCAPIAPR